MNMDFGTAVPILIAAIGGAIALINRMVNRALKKADELDADRKTRIDDMQGEIKELKNAANTLGLERLKWEEESADLRLLVDTQRDQLEKQQQSLDTLEDSYHRVQESYARDRKEWDREKADLERRVEWLTEQYEQLRAEADRKRDEIRNLRDKLQQAGQDNAVLQAKLETQSELQSSLMTSIDRWIEAATKQQERPAA